MNRRTLLFAITFIVIGWGMAVVQTWQEITNGLVAWDALLIFALSGILLNVALSFLNILMRQKKEARRLDARESAMALFVVVPAEEGILRGLVLRYTLPLMPAPLAIAVNSALWTVFHPWGETREGQHTTWQGIVTLFLNGVALCLIFVAGGITGSIAAHASYNLTSMLLWAILRKR